MSHFTFFQREWPTIYEATSEEQQEKYLSLVFREHGRVVNRHVPEADLSELQQKLEQRDKSRKKVQAQKKRMAYLERLLHQPRRQKELKQ